MRFLLIVTLLYLPAFLVFLKRYFASSCACVLYLCTHHVMHLDVSALLSKCFQEIQLLSSLPSVSPRGIPDRPFLNEIFMRWSSLTRICRGQPKLEGAVDALNLCRSGETTDDCTIELNTK